MPHKNVNATSAVKYNILPFLNQSKAVFCFPFYIVIKPMIAHAHIKFYFGFLDF